MVNMKQSKEESREYSQPVEMDEPEYPYGLCIHLHDDSLEKLGITSLPKVGSEMTITAKVFVKSTSAYNTQKGESEMSMDLQITDMEISPAQSSSSQASMLYGDAS
jgi:hypothetical protein